MKKLFALLLAVLMCLALVACGGDTTNETGKEPVVITTDNWDDYLEFVVETNDTIGVLDYTLYLKAKDGVVISNETNTAVHFSYKLDEQHFSVENNQVTLGECVAKEDTYTQSFYMYRNENKAGYSEAIGYVPGSSRSDSWILIPNNFVITEIEGTITVS